MANNFDEKIKRLQDALNHLNSVISSGQFQESLNKITEASNVKYEKTEETESVKNTLEMLTKGKSVIEVQQTVTPMLMDLGQLMKKIEEFKKSTHTTDNAIN